MVHLGTIHYGNETFGLIQPVIQGGAPNDDAVIPEQEFDPDEEELPIKLASWIKEEDHQYGNLAILAYDPPEAVGRWRLHNAFSKSISVYAKQLSWTDYEYCIACKGTSPFGATGWHDLLDDYNLATALYRHILQIRTFIVTQALQAVEQLLQSGVNQSQISLTGHSLGGFCAFEVGYILSMRCYGWNAACPPTVFNRAPGPELATHYHIYGDIISCNLMDSSATCFRAMFNNNSNFNEDTTDYVMSDSDTFLSTPYWHETTRFQADQPAPRDFASYWYESYNVIRFTLALIASLRDIASIPRKASQIVQFIRRRIALRRVTRGAALRESLRRLH
jgi:hypothetical protein